MAFGGMGPVNALDLAEQLGIEKVVIPPLFGLFSALGLLLLRLSITSFVLITPTPTNRICGHLNAMADDLVAEAGCSASPRRI